MIVTDELLAKLQEQAGAAKVAGRKVEVDPDVMLCLIDEARASESHLNDAIEHREIVHMLDDPLRSWDWDLLAKDAEGTEIYGALMAICRVLDARREAWQEAANTLNAAIYRGAK